MDIRTEICRKIFVTIEHTYSEVQSEIPSIGLTNVLNDLIFSWIRSENVQMLTRIAVFETAVSTIVIVVKATIVHRTFQGKLFNVTIPLFSNIAINDFYNT